MSNTLDYYNKHSNVFYESTVNLDMSIQYSMFEKYLHAGAHILDCGCGSGRDTKYFLEHGYEVTAIDGSEKMCKLSSKLTGLEVKNILFQDINYIEEFDGIWACASLLHIPKSTLFNIMKKITNALKNFGILYVSFKYGEYEGDINGRFFSYLNNESFSKIVSEIPEFIIKEQSISIDVRLDKEERWLNTILVKQKK